MPVPRTPHRLFLLAVLLALLLATSAASAQTAYTATELGTLGGGNSQAYAINDYGQIVGRSQDLEAATHAFHWQAGDMLDLNVELRWGRRIMQLEYGVAYDISNTDLVVGATPCTLVTRYTPPPDAVGSDRPSGADLQAFVYRPAASDLTTPYPGDPLVHLGTLGSDTNLESGAAGISRNGMYVVGWSDLVLNGQVHAFLATPVNGEWASTNVVCETPHNPLLRDLGTLRTIDGTSGGTAVNNSGQVVGYSYSATMGYAAFFIQSPTDTDGDGLPDQWYTDTDADSANDLMSDLGTLGGHNGWARDLNDLSQIVGESDTADWQTHAFLWQDGTMTDLGTLGGTASSAAAINNGGQVVGWSLNASGDRRAVIWQDGTISDLNDALPSGFHVRLVEARDITDTGRIVGWGSVGAGDDAQEMAFLLTPTSDTPPAGAGDSEDGGDDSGDQTTGGAYEDPDLLPIEPDTTGSAAGDETGGGAAPAPCGVGMIITLPFVLAGLCGLKIRLRRTL